MRVLHLVAPEAPEGGPCTLRLLADAARRMNGDHHDVLIVGGTEQLKTAARCGVTTCGSLCPPRALPWAGTRALRQFLRTMQGSRGRYDLIHAWTARTAVLASLTAGGEIPQVVSLHTGPTASFASRYSLRYLRRRRQPLLAASIAVRREHKAAGVPANRLTLFPPAVDGDPAGMIDRQSVRERWADMAEMRIDPGTFVLGFLGEPPTWINAPDAATVAARIALSGRSLKLVLHPSCSRRIEAQHMLTRLGFADSMIIDDAAAEPWQVVNGLDAALFIGGDSPARPMPSLLPVLWALAAGVPVVAARNDAMRDTIDDGVNGLLVPHGDINSAADAVVRLIDDRKWAASLGDHGRTTVQETFSIDEYCVRLRNAYELLLADRSIMTLEDPTHRSGFHLEPAGS